MQTRFSRPIAILLLLALLPGAALRGETGQKWGVLVGVNKYASLDPLKYCQRDAAALRERLLRAGFADRNVFLLTSDAAEAKQLPLKPNIERQLEVVLHLAETGDMVVVSFSGHGISSGGRTFLCPTEADLEAPDRTMVALDFVYQALSECQASQKMLWIDACRNDPRRGGSRDAYTKSLEGISKSLAQPPTGVLVLASCDEGQRSWEDDRWQQGVFTHYLLEGLSGKADEEAGDRNRRVSLLELYKYANLNTKREVARQWNGALQTPELFGRITGDFDIAESLELAREIANSIGMKLVLIPAGEFMIGSSESAEETAAYLNRAYFLGVKAGFAEEHPQHRVRITQPFYLGQHEVTVGQFRQFVEDSGYRTDGEMNDRYEGAYGFNADTGKLELNARYSWRNAGFSQTDDHPVVNVSWNDAAGFCRWLSSKEGKTYRLPTEAEWEYACRAGTTTRFWFGDDAEGLAQVTNVADATAKAKFRTLPAISASDGYVFTAPVGRYRPNGFGLFDMHGNVRDWCADWYDSSYYANSPVVDPTGPSGGSRRVYRGGGWYSGALDCRSASRSSGPPEYRSFNLGFRIARVAE